MFKFIKSLFSKEISLENKQPVSLDNCVDYVIRNIDFSSNYDVGIWHHTVGRKIRNDLHLWESKNPIVWWFKNNLQIGHADDISAIIINAAFAKRNGKKYDPTEDVKIFHEHWAAFDCDKYGNPVDNSLQQS